MTLLPEPPDELLTAVADQADARVRGDVQGVARYLTAEAVDSLRAAFPGGPPRVTAYDIERHQSRGDEHLFDVRYSARDVSFVVRSRWRRLEGAWMVVQAGRLVEGDGRPRGLVSRLRDSLLRAIGRR